MNDGRRIVVLGVGNVLLTDEGVGIRAVEELSKMRFPEDKVEFIDGGTEGYGLIAMIEGAERLIVVDAVDARSEPGTIYRFTPEDVLPDENEKKPSARWSLHDVGLIDALQLAKFVGNYCDTILFGIQPKTLEWGMELSPEIAAKLPRLVELVAEEINKTLEGNVD